MAMTEADFITRLRNLATHPAARGLMDDAAVLGDLVLTHDMIVEGVHFLPDDAPADVAWKLVAVNMSDLGAKGAEPIGVMLGYPLSDDAGWDGAFLDGLGTALAAFDVALLGGDTVGVPPGTPRSLNLTAIGRAPECGAPARGGAQDGDHLWVTGTIGDAGLGLAIRQGRASGPDRLVQSYTRPQPPVAFGGSVAPQVHAMMDVSDGLLIDAARMAEASDLALVMVLDDIPLSPEWIAVSGATLAARITAATAGDDYQFLFAASPDATDAVHAAARANAVRVTQIGRFGEGRGITSRYGGQSAPLPERLGYLHGERAK